MPADPERGAEWIERFVAYLAPEVPPIAGRVLGWMMICRPAEQSAAQIAAAIEASRASLTTSLRMLTVGGFLTRVTRAGDRTAYYRVDDEAWQRVVQRQIASIETFQALAEDGIALLDDESQSARLRNALAVFDWMANTFKNAPAMPGSRRAQP